MGTSQSSLPHKIYPLSHSRFLAASAINASQSCDGKSFDDKMK